MKKYFLGLDIGTNSIGWAVTDDEYNILKFNGKAMWGSHLFDTGSTAVERRMHRSARRRRERQVQRKKLLREFFENEIKKVDSKFYERMDDSFFWADDKKENQKNTLFNDKEYDDKKYHEQYPTIYHLRYAMMHTRTKPDIRLVYLAIAHILKHRGHFLYEGKMNMGDNFYEIYNEWCNEAYSLLDEDLSLTSTDELQNILKEAAGVTVKKKLLAKLFDADAAKPLIELLSGANVKIEKIFGEEYKDCEVKSISLKSGGFEDDIKDTLASEIGEDNLHLLEKTKALYDWGVLAELLKGHKYISEAKKDIFDKHRNDLKILKQTVKKYLKNKYDKVFTSEKEKNNYASYIGITKKNGKKINVNPCGRDEFYKYVKSLLKDIPDDAEEKSDILSEIEKETFMPKQVTKDNSVIPYQVNLEELKQILNNASRYYEFLNEKDDYGTVSEKIESLLTFRIPYYVGPLNASHNKFAWIEKKENIQIFPWNFDEAVNKDLTAAKFIERMTNKCSYIPSEPVLAKNSILYGKYLVFNDLNNLRINSCKLSNDMKLEIYENLFCKKAQVKKKDIIKFFKNKYGDIDDLNEDSVTGIAGDFKCSMKSYIDFEKIIGDKISNEAMVDEIIRLITIFGDEKKMLARNIKKQFSTALSDEEINKISKLNYSGWGRLSRKLLCGIYSRDSHLSVIDIMIHTEDNFMQIINNDEYGFNEQIEAIQNEERTRVGIGTYSSLEDLYVSPANKKRIWRVMVVVKEIVKIMGCEPNKIFIEMARGVDENPGASKESRKSQLQALYKSIKADKALVQSLENETESTLRQKKLYLYYCQLGKCMYSGRSIDLSDLSSYDIEHIIPRSVKFDDSTDNTALVYRPLNAKKSDTYPIPDGVVSEKAKELWKILKSKNLISEEKYARLTRKTPLSVEEKAEFIARQLVDTRQTTKIVADIFKQMYSESEIVYVRAKNVSHFRNGSYIKKNEKEQYKDDCLVKVREINDYHHAKDAYLNIVVGNIYNEKFNHDPMVYIKKGGKYHLERIFEYDVPKANWVAGHDGTIVKIKRILSKNNILYTEMPYEVRGGFYDQNIVPHGGGQYPIKTSDVRYSNFERYGGYKNVRGAYFCIVQSTVKKKSVVTIESVPIYFAAHNEAEPEKLKKYFESCGMENVEILVPKVKIRSLMKVGGAFARITGRTGNQILMQNSMQLCLSDEDEKYIKKIVKYIDSLAKNTGAGLDENHNAINTEDNIRLYNMFIAKLKTKAYSEFLSAQIKNLSEGREQFIKLSLAEQNKVLYEILKLFKCDRTTADLSLIGKTSSAGIMRINKKIDMSKKCLLINQSPTGLFENQIDISRL